MSQELQYNLLIVSDVHLGESLRPGSTDVDSRDLELAETQFCGFVRYHQSRRREGKSWRLVINGDLLDFLAVVVGEGKYGEARNLNASLEKLELIANAHINVCKTLAAFVAAGNRIEIIAGNHDTELQLPEVQERFIELIANAGQLGPEVTKGSISFHAWFFHEPGAVWIEHGHQYDDSCSLRHSLVPMNPHTQAVFENVDTAGMRYMTNQIPNLDPGVTETWTAGGFLKFAFNQGVKGACQVGAGYWRFSSSLFRSYRGLKGFASYDLHMAQSEKLAALAREREVDESTLRAVSRLGATPAVSSVFRLAQVLMVDRLVLSTITAFLSIVFMTLFPLLWAGVLSVATIAASTLALSWLSASRELASADAMSKIAARIGTLVGVKVVAFGHTHEPVHRLVNGVAYVNSGTWMPSENPGLLRTFVYTQVLSDGTVSVRRWVGSRSELLIQPSLDGVEPLRSPAHAPATVDVTRAA